LDIFGSLGPSAGIAQFVKLEVENLLPFCQLKFQSGCTSVWDHLWVSLGHVWRYYSMYGLTVCRTQVAC